MFPHALPSSRGRLRRFRSITLLTRIGSRLFQQPVTAEVTR
jgi:hypothetical protein